MSTPVTIYIIHRSGEWKGSTADFWAGFHDDLNKPGVRSGGVNRYEALGSLIIHNPERVKGGIEKVVFLDQFGNQQAGELGAEGGAG